MSTPTRHQIGIAASRSRSHSSSVTIGRLILAALSVLTVLGTAAADLSWLHAQNANWPPHARFHAMWHVAHVAAVQCVMLALLWADRTQHPAGRVSIAAGLLAAYALSFLVSATAAPMFGASITPDVPADVMPPRPLGLDGNLFSVLVVSPLIVIGWWMARREEPLTR